MARLDASRVACWRELQSVTAELERRIDEALSAQWDVPLAWFDVLAALAGHGGTARPSEIADELRVVRSSLSRRLDHLEAEGWVTRSRSRVPSDQRAVVVELTARGRALWRAMNVTYRRAVQACVSAPLEARDVEDLRRVLAVLGGRLGATG